MSKVLIVGIGNEIRQDDGIGPYCLKLLKHMPAYANNKLVDCLTVHQLDITHCTTFADYGLIIFIDAAAGDSPQSVRVEEIKPKPQPRNFTSHIGSIYDILSLTQSLYGVTPKGYLVAVSGLSFEVGEGLSHTALKNATIAIQIVQELTDKFLPLG